MENNTHSKANSEQFFAKNNELTMNLVNITMSTKITDQQIKESMFSSPFHFSTHEMYVSILPTWVS